MNRSELDRLGERLRSGLNAADLTLLDQHRQHFAGAYDTVVSRIRSELGLEVSGRPAKSTTAIVDKLRRSSMRLTQMQDIAGCRTIVADIDKQDQLAAALGSMFDVTVFDRRAKPSHGYRALHLIVRDAEFPVEIQIRTELQHSWAELSEKIADRVGIQVKYGGGSVVIQEVLAGLSALVATFEDGTKSARLDSTVVHSLGKRIRNLFGRIADQLEKIP
jgi:putative GTP pyrophosphokinase